MELIRQNKIISSEGTNKLYLIEKLNHHFETLIDEINDEEVIADWMKELTLMQIPETIQYLYSLKIHCADRRVSE